MKTFNKELPPLRRSSFSSIDARPDFMPNTSLPRHRWYRFKEGFSAGLVRAFVDDYMPAKRAGYILDPFLGSGTTAVEGARLGHNVHGIETNPFMAFLARVKTRDYSDLRNLEGIAANCMTGRSRRSAFALPGNTTLVERKGLQKWLLNRSVGRRFEELRTAIAQVRPPVIRDLLLLALVSSIEEVANARKDGKCWRYKTSWKRLKFDGEDLDEVFAQRVMQFGDDIETCPRLLGHAKVTRADARLLSHHCMGDVQYDGVLTSPPYLNSFDYTDIYRPELLLLKAAKDSNELRRLRFSTVRSHVQVAWKPSKALDIPVLQETIETIAGAGLWCGRIPQMVNAYFVDLSRVVQRCAERLRRGAYTAFVVADSAYCGVVIPVDLVLAELLSKAGFRVKGITVLRQTLGNGNHQNRSGGNLKEFVVLAQMASLSKVHTTT